MKYVFIIATLLSWALTFGAPAYGADPNLQAFMRQSYEQDVAQLREFSRKELPLRLDATSRMVQFELVSRTMIVGIQMTDGTAEKLRDVTRECMGLMWDALVTTYCMQSKTRAILAKGYPITISIYDTAGQMARMMPPIYVANCRQ